MNFSLGFALLLPSLQFMQKFPAKEQCKRNRENYLHFIYTRGLVYLEANAFTSDLAAVPMEFLDVRKTSSYNGIHLYDFPIVFPLPSLLIWWNELLLLYLCLSASLFLRVFPNCFSLHFGISSTPRQMACGNFLIHWWRAEKKQENFQFISSKYSCFHMHHAFFWVSSPSMRLYVVLPFLRYAYRKTNKFVVFISKFT